VDALGAAGKAVQPVMITVDPDHDTPEVLRRELEKIHPRLLGLTGSRQALDIAYRAYRLKPELVGTDLAGNTVVSHSSYIYLMERDGTLATLFPPILSPQRMSEIIASYLPLDS
jgi:protein SCO1/2